MVPYSGYPCALANRTLFLAHLASYTGSDLIRVRHNSRVSQRLTLGAFLCLGCLTYFLQFHLVNHYGLALFCSSFFA